MNTYKSLMITCVGLLASASSLAAWSYGNATPHYTQDSSAVQQRDYQPLDGTYSESYYRGNRVSEENDDQRAIGPLYNNGSRPNEMQQQPGKKFISLNAETTNVGDRVRAALQNTKELSNSAKAVIVTADSNGNVSISGTATNAAEKAKIESIVQSVAGVHHLTTKINVINQK